MAEFTAIGEVITTRGGDLGIRVENEAEIQDFWREHEIDTDLGWFDRRMSVISINRKRDVARCKVGDRVSITVKVVDRSNGKRGIDTFGFQILIRKP